MSLQDSLFSEDVEDDVITFAKNKTRRRVLVFPPVNNYRRFIIHQLVQERFADLLHTFSIGQGSARRTVVCYKSDVKRDSNPKTNASERRTSPVTKQADRIHEMGVEGRRSSSASPERVPLQRQAKSVPAVEIYRPPAARRANNCSQISETQIQAAADSSSIKNVRQRRPDRAVYVPKHRRSLGTEEKTNLRTSDTSHATLNENSNTNNNSKLQDVYCIQPSMDNPDPDNKISESRNMEIDDQPPQEISNDIVSLDFKETFDHETHGDTEYTHKPSDKLEEDVPMLSEQKETVVVNTNYSLLTSDKLEIDDEEVERTQSTVKENKAMSKHVNSNDIINHNDGPLLEQKIVSDVLMISDTVEKEAKHPTKVPAILMSPERKVKKVERQKSKPAPPPAAPLKINRDECDWDSLFDDNGDCLDPTLIEELTSAVGEVMIEQPKNDYKVYNKQIQVSSDEFAHVVEIYNFPSEFKTSDLAAVFSPFRNGGFELKWVDDTHCLGVFSSPLVAAEVLASDHPFVKTRPLSEASALSKTKARRSAEFLQPYRNRPETCAALARRLVTGALGVKLATARQEREHEKNVLREAKEKRRLANKQREDVWEGIIPEK